MIGYNCNSYEKHMVSKTIFNTKIWKAGIPVILVQLMFIAGHARKVGSR